VTISVLIIVFKELGLVFSIIIIGIVWLWWKNIRIERQKQKFDEMRNEYAASGRNNRDKEVLKRQRKNMNELVTLVNKLLNKHKNEIPPRLLDETKNSIRSYIDSVEFDKLYSLYEMLQESDATNINDNLKNFRG
jgi:hypothetical protein